jgi:hypothetical protein
MTIKDTDEKRIFFNPLIKLKRSAIDSIPKEYKIKEFFNKGLFQSLLIHNGGMSASSLLQATRAGYIDNNIKITLDTIFPVGSVIYINKKPYAIGDVQWTNGDWKMDLKQKKQEIDINKVRDPQLYTQLVREEITSGEEELNQIPEALRTGVNYTGPPVIVPPPAAQPPAAQPPATQPPAAQPPAAQPPAAQPPAEQPLAARPPVARPPPEQPPAAQRQQINGEQPEEVRSGVEELEPEELNLCESFKEQLKGKVNRNSTLFFRNFFKIKKNREPRTKKIIDSKFGQLIQKIFLKFPNNLKEITNQFLFLMTGYELPKNITSKQLQTISPTAYDYSCDIIEILEAPTDGNCFFQAVADGINIYNCENEKSKITYANYGKTLLFTASIIREVVLRYIRSFTPQNIANMLRIASNYLPELNRDFDSSIRGLEREYGRKLNEEEYLEVLGNIYNSNENFLIYKPTKSSIYSDEYYTPFRVLTANEIENYIMSVDYWANEFAIEALCSILKICVITIEKYDYTSTLTIKTKLVQRLQAILQDKDKVNETCSNRVMFLFNSNNHYELIRFKYKNKKVNITKQYGNREEIFLEKWYTIFTEDVAPPPIYILFLLYGSIYSVLNLEARQEFKLYKTTMDIINQSVLNNLMDDESKVTFINLFNDTFPHRGSSIETLLDQYPRQQPGRHPGRGRQRSREQPGQQPDQQPNHADFVRVDSEFDETNPQHQEWLNNEIAALRSGEEEVPRQQRRPTDFSQAEQRYPNLAQIDGGNRNNYSLVGGQQPNPYPYQPYPYQPYPYQPYPYPVARNFYKKPEERESSKLAYIINIDMELHPGTSLTPEQINESKCNNKYNAIRKSYAEFTGTPYVIPPVYQTKPEKKQIQNTKKNKIAQQGNKTRKNI